MLIYELFKAQILGKKIVEVKSNGEDSGSDYILSGNSEGIHFEDSEEEEEKKLKRDPNPRSIPRSWSKLKKL